jgi:hypothetical protein
MEGNVKTIYKYKLDTGLIEVEVPAGYEVRHVGLDGQGAACVWIEIDTGEDSDNVKLEFRVFGTGTPIPQDDYHYAGTFHVQPFVWHVYYKYKGEA